MADSIVKLRIDSQEYDAKLKKASDALSRYFDNVRAGGGTLEHLDEGVMDAVKAMGKMETASTSTRGKLRELTQATADMLSQYRQLTDTERASQLGQEMASAVQQMTERAGEMRDAMDDANASIKNAASDTRAFDQVAGGINLMTSGFQAAQGAAQLLGIKMDDNVEVIANLQAAMAVTNGLMTAQNLLQGQSALMMGVQAAQASLAAAAQTALAAATGSATVAQKAYNLIANANPYVLLGTAVVTLTGALWAFSSASSESKRKEEELAQAQEEAQKAADEQRKSLVNASASAMNTASRISSLQEAFVNANTEIGKTSILKEAQTEFKKLGLECKTLNETQNLLVNEGGKVIELIRLQGDAAAVSALRMESYKKSFSMLLENGYDTQAAAILAGSNESVQQLDDQLTKIQARAASIKSSLPTSGGTGGSGKTDEKGDVKAEPQVGSLDYYKNKLSGLTALYNAAGESVRDGYLVEMIAVEKQIDIINSKSELLRENMKGLLIPTAADIKTTGLADVGDLVGGAFSEDAASMELNIPLKLQLDEASMQAVHEHIQGITGDAKNAQKAFGLAANSVGNVGSALESIDDPATKAAGTILQAIASIALGFAQASQAQDTVGSGWGWIAWLAAGTAALATTISTVHSLTGMAEGGIVKGNTYSGDNIYAGNAMVNAGELVLNHAQQGNLAAQLQDSRPASMGVSRVSGEQIYVALGAYLQRTGRGELVTWK